MMKITSEVTISYYTYDTELISLHTLEVHYSHIQSNFLTAFNYFKCQQFFKISDCSICPLEFCI